MSGSTGKNWADKYVKENREIAPHLIDYLGKDFTPLALTYIIKFMKGEDISESVMKTFEDIIPKKTMEEIWQKRISKR